MSTMTKLNIDAIENFSVPKFKLMDYNNYIVTYWNNDSGVNFVPNLGENEHVETIVYENGQKCVYCYKDEITTISDNAFNGCYGLVSVIIPEGVTSIGDGAFYVCGDLKNVSIPNTVTSIGNNVFAICGNLESIIIPDSVTTIGDEAFYFCGLKNIKLSNNLTSIATNAFYGCDRLTDIIIPDSVTTIGESAFSWCNNLTNVTMGNNVATIGNSAFTNCSKIANITFPETLTRIGDSAFADCTNIARIYCKASKTPKLGTSALPVKKISRKFYVKANLVNSYISSWSNYLYEESVIGTIFEDEDITSGLNIKTINGQSILGNGNLFGLNLSSRVINLENLAYDEEYSLVLTVNEYIKVNGELPKDFYISLSSSTIDDEMIHEYIVEFRTNVKGTSVYLPSEIKWEDGIEPYFENDCDYQIRIVNNLGKCTKFDYNRSSNTTLYYRTTDNAPLADNFFTNNFINIDGNTVGVSSHTYDYGQGVVVFDSEIAEIKSNAFINCSRLSNMVLPYGVTNIASYAFANCYNLESIEIPYSVTTIGSGAFKRCENLTNIELPYGISEISSHTFEGCSNLTNVTIPYSVTSIGMYAFSESGLTNVDIPYGVQYIYSNAFAYCENLKSIIISDSVFSINEFSFVGCTSLEDISIGNGVTNLSANIFSDFVNLKTVYLGSGITSIEPGLFANCEKLESITFGYGITNIGFRAFENCKSLKSITCSYGLETIQEKAFAGCSSLTSVVLPDSLISIDLDAFYNCFNLSYINLGNGIQNIGTQAFFGCSSLETIYIPESLKDIGRKAFAYCSRLKSFTGSHISNDGFAIVMHYNATNRDVLEVFAPGCDVVDYNITYSVHEIGACAFYACEKLQKIYIPYGIDTIGESAFENCYNLKTVNLSSYANVNTIGQYAFSGCYSLKNFNLEGMSTLQNIGSAAFFGCTGLTEVRFPYSLMSIQDEAFAHCSGLKSVYFTGPLFNYGGYDIFKGCNALMDINIDTINTWLYMQFTNGEANPLSHSARLNLSGAIVTDIFGDDFNEDIFEIKNYAFYKYRYLQRVILTPEQLTSIGECAFYDCSNTTIIGLGKYINYIGVDAFYNCSGNVYVTSYILNNGFENTLSNNKFTGVYFDTIEESTAIPSEFLMGNQSILAISLGNNIISIGNDAFNGCTNLNTIFLGSGLTSIGDRAFMGCACQSLSIPDNVTTIGEYAFANSAIESITLSNSLAELSSGLCENCINLTSITIPDSVTTLADNTFKGCVNMHSFSGKFSYDTRYIIIDDKLYYVGSRNISCAIPDHVTTIAPYAFYNCQRLHTLTIPSNITTLEGVPFANCSRLSEIITYPEIAPSIAFETITNLPSGGTLRCSGTADYSSWLHLLNELNELNWSIDIVFEGSDYHDLEISANDVTARETKTDITWTCLCDGIDVINGNAVTNRVIEGSATSATFARNLETEPVERTITYTYRGLEAETTIQQAGWIVPTYTIELNDQWRESTSYSSSTISKDYNGIYESFSNRNIADSSAVMTVTFEGYEDFRALIQNSGKSDTSYTAVSELDKTIDYTTDINNTELVKSYTSGNLNKITNLSSYTPVEFTGLKGKPHSIQIMYKKVDENIVGQDRGFALLPKPLFPCNLSYTDSDELISDRVMDLYAYLNDRYKPAPHGDEYTLLSIEPITVDLTLENVANPIHVQFDVDTISTVNTGSFNNSFVKNRIILNNQTNSEFVLIDADGTFRLITSELLFENILPFELNYGGDEASAVDNGVVARCFREYLLKKYDLINNANKFIDISSDWRVEVMGSSNITQSVYTIRYNSNEDELHLITTQISRLNANYVSSLVLTSDGLVYFKGMLNDNAKFTVVGADGVTTSLQAEPGMTWNNWIKSAYNTKSCSVSTQNVAWKIVENTETGGFSHHLITNYNSELVLVSDTIQDGTAYTITVVDNYLAHEQSW